MKHVSHLVWFVRWLQRLGSALLRRRKVIDLCPSFLLPRGRILYDRRVGAFRHFELRKQLADYWAYDHCLAVSALDLGNFPQWKNLCARYEKMLAEGKVPVVLDCGANIGLSAYWFAVELPEALVIAVEPDADNVKLAVRNTKFCTNVKLVQAAVASQDCRLTLTNTHMGADAFRTITDSEGELVGYSIASLVNMAGGELENLLLAKVDIEGFEHELFSANTDWVDHSQALVVETHDWMLPGQAGANNLLQVISRTPRDFVIHGEHIVSFRL
jgi:FkbM family methyltransferase